jgi:hypothetical protein
LLPTTALPPELYINRGTGIVDARTLTDAPDGTADGLPRTMSINKAMSIFFMSERTNRSLLINAAAVFQQSSYCLQYGRTDDFLSPTSLDWDNDGDQVSDYNCS